MYVSLSNLKLAKYFQSRQITNLLNIFNLAIFSRRSNMVELQLYTQPLDTHLKYVDLISRHIAIILAIISHYCDFPI